MNKTYITYVKQLFRCESSTSWTRNADVYQPSRYPSRPCQPSTYFVSVNSILKKQTVSNCTKVMKTTPWKRRDLTSQYPKALVHAANAYSHLVSTLKEGQLYAKVMRQLNQNVLKNSFVISWLFCKSTVKRTWSVVASNCHFFDHRKNLMLASPAYTLFAMSKPSISEEFEAGWTCQVLEHSHEQ